LEQEMALFEEELVPSEEEMVGEQSGRCLAGLVSRDQRQGDFFCIYFVMGS
jgi:hypothetical protein